MELSEYAELISSQIHQNPLQRKRVSSAKTVYSLLKEDIAVGCVIPPLVLALPEPMEALDAATDDDVLAHIRQSQQKLVILDGLQRTYTILDLLSEIGSSASESPTKLRVEIYIGINRLGILYRMLTLNTGQTPMSLRQQIEMLYSDYQSKTFDSGVELLTEAEGRYAREPKQYVFKDVIDGFNSYLNRDELPIDRAGVLENIKSLEKLATENREADLFEDFVSLLDSFMQKMLSLVGDSRLPEEYISANPGPFGDSIPRIFKRAQAISGLGAAVGIMVERKILPDLASASTALNNIEIEDPEELLVGLNDALLWLKEHATKIGNAQRSFFTFFFRELLYADSDSYGKPAAATASALRRYQAQIY